MITNGSAPPVPLSRAFIYYEARMLEGTENEDSGARVRDGCKVLQTIGVCTEDLFPYTPGHFRDVPPDLDIAAAAQYKIATYTRLNSSDEARAALAAKMSVVIGIAVYESFERAIGPDGRVPLPRPAETLLGGHCLYLRGYRPDPANAGMFLFDMVNSWGPEWADHGVCYIPEGYLNNPNLATDLWSIAL